MSQDTTIEDCEAEAGRRLAGALDPSVIDALLADAQASGTPIDGADGLLNKMTKAVIERVLAAEMTHELGYAYGDPAGAGSGNSRNGHSTKDDLHDERAGHPLGAAGPQHRGSSRGSCRSGPGGSGVIDEMILSLYARGLSTRDIEAHLGEVYGVTASRELISNVTEVVTDEITWWGEPAGRRGLPDRLHRRDPHQGPGQGRGQE